MEECVLEDPKSNSSYLMKNMNKQNSDYERRRLSINLLKVNKTDQVRI